MRIWFLFLASTLVCFGQSTPPPGSEAEKYHQMLLKRPQPGLVYDRFYSAWMENGTADSLAEFLSHRTSTAADLLLLAIFHDQRGNEAEALKAYTAALERDGTNARAWFQRAKLEARMMNFEPALKSLAEAGKGASDATMTREIGQMRGRWLLRTGKPEAALQAWRDLLKANADDEDLVEEVVELLLDEGLFAEAESQMLALIASTKDAYAKAVRQLRLAEIQLRATKKEAALTMMTETLANTGRGTWIEGEVLAQVEAVFRRDENLSGLVKELEKLQAAHPQRTALERQRARVLAELGEKDKALATYAALLQKTPGQRDLRESYLDLLARFEQFKEAIAQTNVLLEQSPDDRELLIRLATLQERAKDKAAAKATLEKFLAAKDTAEFDHLRVARLYESWERAEDATQAYERMVAAFPESSAAKEAQAHYLHRSGKKDAAFAIWRELAKNGDLPQVMAVGQALMTRLEPQTALEVLQKRQTEFASDDRFLGLLINAAINSKKTTDAIPWALARVRSTADITFLDDALRQVVLCLNADQAKFADTLASLQKGTPTVQERILLSALLEEKQDLLGAEKTLRDIPAEHALAAQTRLLKLMESRQDWLRAAAEAEKLIAMPQARNSTNMQRLVDLAERAGKPDQALKWVADWKTLSPGSSSPWLREARLLQGDGKSREALKVLQAAVRKFEDDEAVADALASSYTELGQMSDAEKIYFSLFEKEDKPEDKMRWVGTLARLANDRGQLKALTEKFLERQRTNRADAAPWLALAEIYRIAGNATEQERALHEAMRLRPDDANLAMQIARTEMDMGQWKRAIEELQRVAGRAKGGRVQQMIASIQIEYGDANVGYRMLYEIAGGAQMDADDALTLVKSMTAQQDWKRVVGFMEPLLRRFPEDYRLGYLQAVALEESGKADAAAALFIRFMGQTQELPAILATKKAPVNQFDSDWVEKNMPKGYADLSRLTGSGAFYQAYNYRSGSFRVYGQGSSKAVMVPSGLDNLKSMSLAHVVTLMKGESVQKQKAWIADAAAAGVPGVRYFDALDIDQYYNLRESADALEKHPDDDALLAWIIGNSENVAFETAARAFDHFKSKYIELSFRAATHAVQADADRGAPLLSEALDALEKMSLEAKRKAGVDHYSLRYMIGGNQSMREESSGAELPAQLRRRILNLVLNHLEEVDTDLQQQKTYRSGVPYEANACRTQLAWKEFAALMERDVRHWTQHEPTRQAWTKYVAQIQQRIRMPAGEMITRLPFPGGTQLPPMMVYYFGHKDLYNPRDDDKLEPEPEDYAGVKPFIDGIQSPVLRALLAYKAGDRARVEKEITQLLSAASPSADDLMLAASWFSIEDKYDRVADLLLRASGMSIPISARPAFDAALVHAVVKQKPQTGSPLLEPAQMALRRLRSTRVSVEQKEQLIAAMKTLSMQEEAEQWARIAMVAPTAPARTSSYVSTTSIDTNKLKTLLSGKDEEAMVREAVVQLRRALAYSANGNGSYAASRAKEIMRLVGRPGIPEKIRAVFDPGESASVAKRYEQAQFFMLIEQRLEAMKLLEKIVERDPKHFEARLHLCAMIAITDAARAVKMMSDIPVSAYQQSGVGSQIAELLRRDDSITFEGRMNIVVALTGMLASVPPTAGVKGLDWMIDLPATVANQTYRNPRLDHLYSRPDSSEDEDQDRSLPAKSPEAMKRREVHDALCLAMMKHPALAEEGFRRFACVMINEGNKNDELAATARRLLEEAKAASGPQRGPSLTRRFNYYQEVTGLWAPSPAEFLIWKAWKENQQDRVEQDIMPLVAAAQDATHQSMLRGQWNIWTCKPEEFVSKAKAYITATNGRNNSGYGSDPHLVWVVDRWEERGIEGTPLDELFAANLKQARGFGDGYAVSHYLAARRRLRPEAAVEPFLVQLISGALGNNQDAWAKAISPTITSRYGRGGSISNPSAYTLLQIIDNMIRKPATFGAGLQMATLVGATENPNWTRNASYNMTTVAKSSEHAMAGLHALGWLGAPEQIALPNDPNCLQVLFIKKIRENRDTVLDLRPKLAALKQRTLGVEFCEALFQDSPGGPLTALLKRRAADVAKIPVKSGPAFIALVKSQIPALAQPASADPALVKALDPLLGAERQKAMDEIDKWIAATRTEEVYPDADGYAEKVKSMLKTLIPGDPGKAEKLFLHACDLMEIKIRANAWNSYSGANAWTSRSNILDELKKEWAKPETMAFVMRLCHEDTTGQLSSDGWAANSGYGQALIDIWRTNGGPASMGRGIDAMLARTAEVMQDTPHTLMPLAFFDFYQRLPQSLRVPAMKYAARMPATHPQSTLGRDLDFAGRFFLSMDSQSRQNAGAQKAVEELGGLQPMWEHHRTLLRADKANPRVRQALVHFLSYWAHDDIDPECAKLGAAAALISMKQKDCIHGYQYGWIMRAFNHLPMDAAWQAAAQEHWDAWAARVANGGMSKYEPCDWVMNSVLRMTARAGKDDWMREMLRQHHLNFSNEQSGIVSLMMGGQPKLAAEHFKAEWRGFLHDPQKELLWSKEVADNLPAFKEACGDPGLALLGEIYLSYIKDPTKTEQAAIPGFKGREDRFKDIAKRFKETKFADEEMRKDGVELICTLYDVADSMRDVVDEVAAKVNIEALGAIDQTWEHWRQLKPVQFSLGWKAAHGEVQPAIAAYDHALAARSSQSYYHRSLLKESGWGPTWVANWLWAHESEAGRVPDVRAVLPFHDHVLAKTPADLRDEHVSDCVSQKWFIHLVQNEPEAFATWRKGLKEEDRRDFKKRVLADWDMWTFVRQFSGTQKKMRLTPEQRAELIATVAKDEWCIAMYPATGAGIPNLINDIVQKGTVFKPDEFAPVAPLIAAALPRMGRTAGEAGDLLAANGKNDAAVPLFALAFEHARQGNEKDYNLAAGYAVKQAEILERTGKKPEALQVLKSLDEKRLGGGVKKTVETAVTRLSK